MKLTTLTLAATLISGAALAGDVTPATVTFTEDGAVTASLTGVAGNPDAGKEIMSSRSLGNCIACHEVTALLDAPFHGEVGPMLDGVADRWTAAELRGIVANAKMTYEGTIMPSYFKTGTYIRPGDAYTGKAAQGELPPLLSAQQIEDVVAFLATLKEE